MVLWIFCQFVGYQQWPGDRPCQNRGPVTTLPSADPISEYSPPSLPPTPHIPICSHMSVTRFQLPTLSPKFLLQWEYIPNNSPNPSTPRCSITVFRRMGLGAEMAGGEETGQWEDGGMSWAEGWGGKRREEKDKGEERLLFTAMKGCRWRDRHSSSG